MREIRTEIEVDAPPAAVWEVLVDLGSYGAWNPHITRAGGDLQEGGTLDLTVERIGARPRTMTVRVVDVDPPRRLQWVATTGSRWVFRGRHTFELDPLDDARTRFANREALRGLLVPLVVTDVPERDYVRMNRALKAHVEARTEPARAT